MEVIKKRKNKFNNRHKEDRSKNGYGFMIIQSIFSMRKVSKVFCFLPRKINTCLSSK